MSQKKITNLLKFAKFCEFFYKFVEKFTKFGEFQQISNFFVLHKYVKESQNWVEWKKTHTTHHKTMLLIQVLSLVLVWFFLNRLYVGKYVIHCFSHLFTRPPKLSSFSGRLTVIQRTKVDDIAAMTQNNSPKKKF